MARAHEQSTKGQMAAVCKWPDNEDGDEHEVIAIDVMMKDVSINDMGTVTCHTITQYQ